MRTYMNGFLLDGESGRSCFWNYFDGNSIFDSVMNHDVPANVVCLRQTLINSQTAADIVFVELL